MADGTRLDELVADAYLHGDGAPVQADIVADRSSFEFACHGVEQGVQALPVGFVGFGIQCSVMAHTFGHFTVFGLSEQSARHFGL